MKKYITELLEKEEKDIILSIIIGLFIVCVYGIVNYSYVYSMNVHNDIKSNVIRFHVLANSDSDEDQQLKIYVKDSILEKYKDELLENDTREEAIAFFLDNMQDIENYANDLVQEQGYDYPVTCELAYTDFPTKQYNDIKLPAGEYLAFRVLIGAHEGQNFWCVLYPPLCYVDAVDQDNFSDAKNELKENISNDEFLLISEYEKPMISVKFKMVEMWNN